MSKQITEEAPETQTAVMEPVAERVKSPLSTTVSGKLAEKPVAAEAAGPVSSVRKKRAAAVTAPPRRFPAMLYDDDSGNRQAELFYLQKQIQQQTPMVFILEDGERIQGIVEWYDRHSIKVRGKTRVLIYKAAIKYIYKAGEIGSAPEK